MSFFRNLRSSITRGRSSSRDTTPVRNSRPGSVISSLNSGSSKRRDSIESRSDSLLNRSDTFILDDPDGTPTHSNCSTLEKKSKKSKVLEKFSTFTKRKKNPPSEKATFEHHPSDNATNTYYKWQAEGGGNSLDYDCQNDPFNFLYEQQSSLKFLQCTGDSQRAKVSPPSNTFDSSTYRKGKIPTDLKKQLKMLKEPDVSNQENVIDKQVVEVEDEEGEVEFRDKESVKAEKYKTVTLNSFRRSFREKFLQQQKEAAHNPAWFVEVETPELQKNQTDQVNACKEQRRDLLVFENENYRPSSRSPIRDLSNRKETRTATRSPVKRNDTFKVNRLSRLDQQATKPTTQDNTGSIHIEFKNSITPHIPGRMVPVGVAKPMPSQSPHNNYYRKIEQSPLNASHSNKSAKSITSTRLNNHSPVRSPWLKSPSPVRPINPNPTNLGRYQTLVQIKNDQSQQPAPIITRNSRLSTRIQLGGNATSVPDKNANFGMQSPSFGKRYHSSQLLTQCGSKAQPLKQTYFAETPQTAKFTQIPSNLSSSTSGIKTRQPTTVNYGSYKYQTPSLFASTSSLIPLPLPAAAAAAAAASTPATTTSRTTPSHSVGNIYSSSNNNNNLSYHKHHQQQPRHQQQQQHQTRFAVTGQRRSRSPIKIPWR